MKSKLQVISERFLRSFVSGAIASAVPLSVASIQTWGDLRAQLILLSIALMVGGINGVILAGDKLLRWKD